MLQVVPSATSTKRVPIPSTGVSMWPTAAPPQMSYAGMPAANSSNSAMPSISLPDRTSYQDVLGGIMQSLGPAQRVSNAAMPTVPQLSKVTTIPGFDDNFFNSLFEESKRKLNKETFGAGGLMERGTEVLASRGLLGSSIEKDAIGQVNDQYNEKLGSVLADLNRTRAEQQIQEAQKVRDLQQQRDITQSGYQNDANLLGVKLAQETAMKNAEIASALKELGIRSALTEASDISKYNIGKYEQDVNLADIAAEDTRSRQRLYLDMLSSPQVDMNSVQTESILNSIFPGFTQSTGGTSSANMARITQLESQMAGLNPGSSRYQMLKRERDSLIGA